MAEETPLWTPDEIRAVASAIWGASWQTPLASAIAKHSGVQFPQSRIAKWYLPKGGRGIETWLQPELAGILGNALAEVEEARQRAQVIIDQHAAVTDSTQSGE